jgi:Uma2 family endonuclease
MAADPQRLFMSVEEYLELDRNSLDARYEYIDGVVTLLAGGTANHSRISINVVSLLRAALRGSPCEVFNSDLRVGISSTRYVLPDASVSCDPGDLRGENDIVYSPCLIVEVLFPSTEATDRGKKFRYYQSCPSIQEYILISTQEQAVDVYRRASYNLWTLHPFEPGDEVELKSINVSIPLEAFYENVTVPGENG